MRQSCCMVLEVISCACFELWLKYMYLAETCRARTNFNFALKGLKGHVFCEAEFAHQSINEAGLPVLAILPVANT